LPFFFISSDDLFITFLISDNPSNPPLRANFGSKSFTSISNPPYIKKLDLNKLDKDVKDFEPKLALNGGLDGLSEIRKVIKKSSELIKKKGKLILEISFDQKEKVKKLLINKGFYINKILKDYAQNDRCIISTKI
jgi:release factor glutamine methyltransferase